MAFDCTYFVYTYCTLSLFCVKPLLSTSIYHYPVLTRDWQRINCFETVVSFFLFLFRNVKQESTFFRLCFETVKQESTNLSPCFETVKQESTFFRSCFETVNQESTFFRSCFETVKQESLFLRFCFETKNQKPKKLRNFLAFLNGQRLFRLSFWLEVWQRLSSSKFVAYKLFLPQKT